MIRNLADNRAQWAGAFPTTQYVNNFSLGKVNIGIFTQENAANPLIIPCGQVYAIGRTLGDPLISEVIQQLITFGEVLMINMPNDMWLDNGNTASCQDQMVKVVKRLIEYPVGCLADRFLPMPQGVLLCQFKAELLGITSPTQDELNAFFPVAPPQLPVPEAGQQAAPAIAVGPLTELTRADQLKLCLTDWSTAFNLTARLTPAQAAIVLRVMGMHYATFRPSISTFFFTHMALALAKQGNVSAGYINKFTAAVEEETGVRVEIVPDLVSKVYSTYRCCINDQTAHNIFAAWAADLPPNALKVRLLLEQAARAGMTLFYTIEETFRAAPAFPWGQLFRRATYFDEAIKFAAAVVMVGNNQYYGFRRDLGPVASSNYRNLATACRAILVRINPARVTLNRSLGFLRDFPESTYIYRLIDDYIDQGGSGRADDLVRRFNEAVGENAPCKLMVPETPARPAPAPPQMPANPRDALMADIRAIGQRRDGGQ